MEWTKEMIRSKDKMNGKAINTEPSEEEQNGNYALFEFNGKIIFLKAVKKV